MKHPQKTHLLTLKIHGIRGSDVRSLMRKECGVQPWLIGEATRGTPQIDVSRAANPNHTSLQPLGGCQSCGSSKVLTVTHFDLLDDTKDPWRNDDRQFMKSGERGGHAFFLKASNVKKYHKT